MRSKDKPDLVLLDLHLPDASDLDLLAKSRSRYPDVPVIVATASNSVHDVIQALKGGAMDYLTKPIDHQRLVVSLANAVKILRQQQDLTLLRSELKETYRTRAQSKYCASSRTRPCYVPSSKKLTDSIHDRHCARDDASAGTHPRSGAARRDGADYRRKWHGERIGRATLHYSSPRLGEPFVDVNCAALSETLIESELFGHERGAFTSAISRRRGKFEKLRERGLNQQTPVIVITLLAHKGIIAGFQVTDILSKPVSQNELVKALQGCSVAPTKRRPVLVVDDDETSLRLADEMQRQLGYRTVCRQDASSALKAAAKEKPAVVVLDLVMPEMNGFEFLRHFRKTRQGRGVRLSFGRVKT